MSTGDLYARPGVANAVEALPKQFLHRYPKNLATIGLWTVDFGLGTWDVFFVAYVIAGIAAVVFLVSWCTLICILLEEEEEEVRKEEEMMEEKERREKEMMEEKERREKEMMVEKERREKRRRRGRRRKGWRRKGWRRKEKMEENK